MRLDHSSSALVIVGGWNAHILNPEWIGRYLFDGKKQKLKVQFSSELPHGFSLQFPALRVSSKEVRIELQGNKLSISPVEIDQFNRVEEIALKLADYLPHTPVSGFGINYVFTDKNINDDLNNIIRAKDLGIIEKFGASLISQQYTRTLEMDEKILNISIELMEEKVNIKLNFHFEISDLPQFKSLINENRLIDLKEEGIDFITKVYNLELVGDIL